MSNNKENSVELLEEEVYKIINEIEPFAFSYYLEKAFEQAKAMHKKEMIEFAKLHVEAALREASENARIKANTQQGGFSLVNFSVEKESILNSYPLDQIK